MHIRSLEDKVIDGIAYIILTLVLITTLYPFWYAFIISLNDGLDAAMGGIFLWPRKFTLDNYQAVFAMDRLPRAFFITVSRTVLGTISGIFFSGLFAYSLAHKNLIFKGFYTKLLIIVMYFSGGIIPIFVLFKTLHLLDNFMVYIIPALLNPFNVIIMMSFFRTIPESLEEAATIDGANHLQIFFKLIFPVSKPIFATVALFAGVAHWNAWFDSAYYISTGNLRTLAYMLMELINQADLSSLGAEAASHAAELKTYTAETIRMATMMVVIIPIICVYPFLQKYFVKGIMIGSVKG